LVYAWDLDAPGWAVEDESLAGRLPRRIAATAPGAALRYRFRGTTIGVYWLVAPDSGDIAWSIDGAPPQRASSWDPYALQFTRAHYAILSDRLVRGEHEVHIQVLGDKQPESRGTAIRIGALLVH